MLPGTSTQFAGRVVKLVQDLIASFLLHVTDSSAHKHGQISKDEGLDLECVVPSTVEQISADWDHQLLLGSTPQICVATVKRDAIAGRCSAAFVPLAIVVAVLPYCLELSR